MLSPPKIIAIIPAHLRSVRFPKKILFPFFGHPMVEHVRRRALLSQKINDVYVATCDNSIASVVAGYGGKVIMTGDHHLNGTTRIAEAAKKLDATHIILLQGDEPLLLPVYVDAMAEAIILDPGGDAWNGTGPIKTLEDVDRHSFVKCATTNTGRIIYCFRRSPSCAPIKDQQRYIRKILGLIAFRKSFLKELVKLPQAQTEVIESIEQMRIIENNYNLTSVPFKESLPSVNEPEEADIVIKYLLNNPTQKKLLEKTFGIKVK